MKRFAIVLVAALLVFGVSNTASANFYAGILGTFSEVGIDLGDSSNSLTETTVENIFNINAIGDTFDGDSALSDLTIGGWSSEVTLIGRDYLYEAYFATVRGTTADDVTMNLASWDTFNTLNMYVEGKTFTDGFYVDEAWNMTVSGLLNNGNYACLTTKVVAGITLDGLAVGNDIVMDIWSFNNGSTLATDSDDTVASTNWTLTYSLNESGMVSATLSEVPVPGALILMITGLLAAVGVRRKA